MLFSQTTGVSNFDIPRIEYILKNCRIRPAVNQVELHPGLLQPELLEFCAKENIHVTAYSPLGNNVYGKERIIDDPVVCFCKMDRITDVDLLFLRLSMLPRSLTSHLHKFALLLLLNVVFLWYPRVSLLLALLITFKISCWKKKILMKLLSLVLATFVTMILVPRNGMSRSFKHCCMQIKM